MEPWQEVGAGVVGDCRVEGTRIKLSLGGGELMECGKQGVPSRLWKVSSLKRRQPCGEPWQEALEGPARPGMQSSSLCEEDRAQPIRNQGSITTTCGTGLWASAGL